MVKAVYLFGCGCIVFPTSAFEVWVWEWWQVMACDEKFSPPRERGGSSRASTEGLGELLCP